MAELHSTRATRCEPLLGRRRAASAPHSRNLTDRTNLDAAGVRPGELPGDLDRLFHILGLDPIETSQNLFGFTERPVGNLGAAVSDPHPFRRFRTLEHLGLREMATPAEVVCVRAATAHHPGRFGLLARVAELGLVA